MTSFRQRNILPSEKLIKQAKLHFMHFIEYKYAPESFSGIWGKKEISIYIIPNHRTELFKKIAWYSLPLKRNSAGDLVLYVYHYN
jgi:hypothetical protein